MSHRFSKLGESFFTKNFDDSSIFENRRKFFFFKNRSSVMANASDFESEDCGFESHRGRCFFLNIFFTCWENRVGENIRYFPDLPFSHNSRLLPLCESGLFIPRFKFYSVIKYTIRNLILINDVPTRRSL